MAKMRIANITSSAICISGAIARRIDLSTTCRPAFPVHAATRVSLYSSSIGHHKVYTVYSYICILQITTDDVRVKNLLGMPDTNLSGRSTRTARSVRRLTLCCFPRPPNSDKNLQRQAHGRWMGEMGAKPTWTTARCQREVSMSVTISMVGRRLFNYLSVVERYSTRTR